MACRSKFSGEGSCAKSALVRNNPAANSRPMGLKLDSQNTKMGWPKPSHFLLETFLFRLEEELRGKFKDTSPLLLGHFAKVRIGLSQLLRYRVLHEVEVEVAAVKRVQRMVQEVIGLHPELESLRFRDGKVLKHRQVGVEVFRSVSHREQRWPIFANGCWRREATRVDVLMWTQARQRIAGQDGVQLHCICPQDGLVVDRDTRQRVCPRI